MTETTDDDQRIDTASIGPQLNLEDVPIPEEVGRALARAHGIDGTIETGAEWVETTKTALGDEVGATPTVEDLCTSADGRHTFSARDGDHEQSYVCVLDPLIYPFLTDTPGTVRSVTPVREETVDIEIGERAATASHEDAVISLGAATDLDPDADVTFERVYADVCGYVHIFADSDEYEAWETESDGATTAMPAEDGVAVSRELATALFG